VDGHGSSPWAEGPWVKPGHDGLKCDVLGEPRMSGFERHQALAALTMLVAALFVASGYPPAARWRRQLRGAAILAFLIALGAALVEVAIWLAGG